MRQAQLQAQADALLRTLRDAKTGSQRTPMAGSAVDEVIEAIRIQAKDG